MCVIIIKDNNKMMDKDILKSSSRLNPHGLGVVWLDDYSVQYFKSYNYKVLHTERPFIAHFRYATVGKVNKENTHPFICGDNTDEFLMMNGTIKELGDNDNCDSKVLAEILGTMPRHTWKSELEKYTCRFATINTKRKTYQVYNKKMWFEQDGVLYSKSNVLENNYVAVYGTLKINNSNYYRFLSDSQYIGDGTTKDKYPLIIENLPYLINKKGVGHKVIVDVFKVTDEVMLRLDKLEGHPNWYQRKQIPIIVDGVTIKCWVYFNITESHEGKMHHKTYNQHSRQYLVPMYNTPNPRTSHKYNPLPKGQYATTKECDSCLELFETTDLEETICEECNKWLKEFYDSI